jgi:hypothetical protein
MILFNWKTLRPQLVAALGIVLMTAAACIFPISDMTLTTQVDPAGKALNQVSSFTVDAPLIICSLKVEGLPAQSEIKASWLYYEAGSWKVLKEESLPVAGSSYLPFQLKAPPGGWQPGDYIVRFLADGRQQSEKRFAISNQPGIALPVIRDFQSTPQGVSLGQMSTLSWNVSGASRVTISPEIGSVEAGGSKMVTPKTDAVYTITAVNGAGSVYRSLSITVSPAPTENSDLVVTDIFRQVSIVYYTVRNDGSSVSRGCNSGLYLGQSQLSTSYIPPLAPGEQNTLYFGAYSWTYSFPTPATVCADIDQQNTESNRTNNCRTNLLPGGQ